MRTASLGDLSGLSMMAAAFASLTFRRSKSASTNVQAVKPVLASKSVQPRKIGGVEKLAREMRAAHRRLNETRPAYRRLTTNPKKLRRLARLVFAKP
jgi:hypothetical protein